jgi:hypothetical protein
MKLIDFGLALSVREQHRKVRPLSNGFQTLGAA